MLPLCFFFFFLFFSIAPFSPSLTNYTVDRCRVVLTDWPTRLCLFFSPCFWSAQHKLPGDGHDNSFFPLSLVVIWVTMRHVGEKFIMQSVMSNERLDLLPTLVILTGILHVIRERESRGECKLLKCKTLHNSKAFQVFLYILYSISWICYHHELSNFYITVGLNQSTVDATFKDPMKSK